MLFEADLKAQECAIVHTVDVALLGALRVEPLSLIEVDGDAGTLLIAESQVVYGSRVATLRRFLEPLGGLLELPTLVENHAQGVHRFDVAVGRRVVKVLDRLDRISLEDPVAELLVLAELEDGLFAWTVFLGVTIALQGVLSVRLTAVAVWMCAFLEVLTDFVVRVGIVHTFMQVMLGCVVASDCLLHVLLDAKSLLVDVAEDHTRFTIVEAGGLDVVLQRLGFLTFAALADSEEHAVSIIAVTIGPLFLFLHLLCLFGLLGLMLPLTDLLLLFGAILRVQNLLFLLVLLHVVLHFSTLLILDGCFL